MVFEGIPVEMQTSRAPIVKNTKNRKKNKNELEIVLSVISLAPRVLQSIEPGVRGSVERGLSPPSLFVQFSIWKTIGSSEAGWVGGSMSLAAWEEVKRFDLLKVYL